MDANMISSMISTVGFPIVACAAMFWYMYRTDQSHTEEIDNLRTALEQNTLVMQKLCDRLEGGEKK